MAYRFSGSPSIKDRLTSAQRDLLLVRAVLDGVIAGVLETDEENWLTAALACAKRSHEELYWISELPDAILGAPVPDNDEVRALGTGTQPDEVLRAITLDYLRARPEIKEAR